MAMPQFLDAFVLFCIDDAKVRNFHDICKKKSNYFRKIFRSEVFKYSSIQVGQEGFGFLHFFLYYRYYIYYNIYNINISIKFIFS